MKKNRLFYIIILFFLYQSPYVQGQEMRFDCQTVYDSTVFNNKSYEYCNDPDSHLSNYKLDKKGNVLYEQTPLYTINVKAHVIQYSVSDPRNFTYVDSIYLRQGIEALNINYSSLQLPTIPVIPQNLEESDSRIRFNVHSIDFIQDTLGWAEIADMPPVNCNFKIINSNVIRVYSLPSSVLSSLIKNRSCFKIQNSLANDGSYMYYSRTYPLNPQDSVDITILSVLNDINDQTGNLSVRGSIDRRFYSYTKYHKNDTNFLHIYFVRNTSECYTTGFGEAKKIISNALRMVEPGDNERHLSGAWEVNSSGLLAHEIGHCLGSHHTMAYQYDLPSYITDVFQPDNNIGWEFCNTTTISNNIMGYNRCRNYLSPLQIADIRRIVNSNPIIRNTIIETRASTNNDVIITSPNTVWEKHEIIGSNLIIEDGASLTIKCKVHFSPDAKVIIKQGGKLIIDGGTLTNEYNSYWQGIEVWGTSTKNQYPQGSPTYQGILIVKNGGTIENAHVGATNWKPNDYDAIGGVIQATDAIFRNNRVDVGFATYQNFAPSKSYIKVGNHSFFRNTEFFSDNDYIEGFPQRDAH
ncbi:MAG: hypothetical protein H3C31_07070, partial [Brumimicrobium sp.]|nr:hypothetical protein [Brumimicrobium sp.]